MARTVWYFVACSDGRMVRIPRTRVRALLAGEITIDPSPHGDVRLAEVWVAVRGSKVLAYHRCRFPRHVLAWDGTADPDHTIAQALRIMARDPRRDPITGVIHLTEDLARAACHRDHHWSPEVRQLDDIAHALNAHAPYPPVAAVIDGELRGVQAPGAPPVPWMPVARGVP